MNTRQVAQPYRSVLDYAGMATTACGYLRRGTGNALASFYVHEAIHFNSVSSFAPFMAKPTQEHVDTPL
jgi:hypothetical protein